MKEESKGERNLAMKREFMLLGYDQTPRFLLRMTEIGSADKLVLSFILNRMKDFGGGHAFPSVETIAKNNGLSERTVKDCTARLVEKGLLIRKRRGMGKTNEYDLPEELPGWTAKYMEDWTPKRGRIRPTEGQNLPAREAKVAQRKRVVEGEHVEGDPSGAGRVPPFNPQPGKEAAGEVSALPAPEHGGGTQEGPQDAPGAGGGCGQTLEGAKPPVAGQAGASPSVLEGPPRENGIGGEGAANNVPKAHTVCAGGSRKVMPWEKEEEEDGQRRRPKKPRKTGLYDPSKPPSEWNGNDLVGYFRARFKETWPGEGAPDVRLEDLGAAKRRIVWMRDEGMDISLAKKAIDHLFEFWSDGLPRRLRWKGSRPGIALIENARLFEMLVREVQNGPGGGPKVDEWKGDTEDTKKYEERDKVRARLMNEGRTLEQANREANRLVGL